MIIKEADRLNSVQEYYFSRKLRQIREMRANGINVLNLGIGNPDLMPSEETIEELKKSASEANAHGYQSYVGIPELRESIAKWMYRTYGTELKPESEILPLIGSKEGIMHISMAFLNKDDEVLIPDPGYPAYSSVTELVQARSITYPLSEKDNWAPDLDWVRSQDLSKVKIMWINYPNMPTGANLSKEDLEQLVKLARENKFLIVNDNPYSLILNDDPESMLTNQDYRKLCWN